jgi:hypothetical protein
VLQDTLDYPPFPPLKWEQYCPGDAYDGDDEQLLGVSEPADLRPLVGLSEVHILDLFHDGAACVGFEFGCV